MPANFIDIFYDAGTAQIRGVTCYEDNTEFLSFKPHAPVGEALLTVETFPFPERMIFDPINRQYVLDCVSRASGLEARW